MSLTANVLHKTCQLILSPRFNYQHKDIQHNLLPSYWNISITASAANKLNLQNICENVKQQQKIFCPWYNDISTHIILNCNKYKFTDIGAKLDPLKFTIQNDSHWKAKEPLRFTDWRADEYGRHIIHKLILKRILDVSGTRIDLLS